MGRVSEKDGIIMSGTTLKYILSLHEKKRCPDCDVEMTYNGYLFNLIAPMRQLECPECSLIQVETMIKDDEEEI